MSASSSAAISTKARVTWMSRAADFLELTKPRIVTMELITVAMGFYLAARSDWSPWVLLATLGGTGLIAASASALNQLLETARDAQMQRTANRPMPAGRIAPLHAALFAVALLLVGVAVLLAGPGWPTLLLGIVCWCLYVVVYTPLKTRSTLNTAVGAASGAIPIVMGWVAAGGRLDAVAAGLFGVLYLWQYPHFMAIAWRCRDDYQHAGYVMSTTVDPSGRRAGIEAIVGAMLLLPVSLLPALASDTRLAAGLYIAWSVCLTVVYLWAAWAFARVRGDETSRRLLRVSLLYLPGWIVGLLVVAL